MLFSVLYLLPLLLQSGRKHTKQNMLQNENKLFLKKKFISLNETIFNTVHFLIFQTCSRLIGSRFHPQLSLLFYQIKSDVCIPCYMCNYFFFWGGGGGCCFASVPFVTSKTNTIEQSTLK